MLQNLATNIIKPTCDRIDRKKYVYFNVKLREAPKKFEN
jgi:hypothetical protein